MLWIVFAVALADPVVDLPGSDREVVFEDSATAAVEDGMAALAAGRFDAAAGAFGALADAGGNVDARYLEALARYEAGDLRLSETAARRGLDDAPEHGPLLSLYGLILADLGRGGEGQTVLARAQRIADAAGDTELLDRIADNRRLVAMDRGETVSEAADDPLGDLAEELRRGDFDAARKHIPQAPEGNRRAQIHRLLGQAAVSRAEGNLDTAAAKLDKALNLARQGGLVRERAAALAEIGAVYALSGHHQLALDQLQEAIGLVGGTSFKVNEVAFRAEAGRVAVRLGNTAVAQGQLSAARKIVPKSTRFPGAARLDELEGMIGARNGDVAGADAAFERAATNLTGRGYWADAARVSAAAVEMHAAGGDEGSLKRWSVRARDLFSKAGDPVGPAHVLMSVGLGRVRGGDVESAMRAFSECATEAEKTGTPRGASVAAIARANAAEALVVLGHSQKAGDYDLGDAVARHRKFASAEEDYATGLAAYGRRDYAASRTAFDAAYTAFRDLKEPAYALAARRGRAWASWNDVIRMDTAAALPFYGELQQEGIQVGDPELEVRARAAGALALSELGKPGPAESLRIAGNDAEAMGLLDVAAHCWAEVAERETELIDKARAARHAFALNGDASGVYAMYSVSIEAFNAEDYDMALRLAEEAMPKAGELKTSLEEVVVNARAAQE